MAKLGNNHPPAGDPAPKPPVRHRFTRDLARAESLAMMLANSRAADVIEVVDLLAGMYIDNWERLSCYWNNTDEVEDFFRQFCRLSPPRWQYWLGNYDDLVQANRGPKSRLRRLLNWKGVRRRSGGPAKPALKAAKEKVFQLSSELEAVLKDAEKIAPFGDKVEGRAIPILTSECVLFCIARNTDIEIGRKLASTGIEMGELERAARFPKHPPLHQQGDSKT